MAGKTSFKNDWEAIIAKPETTNGVKKFADNEPDPFYIKREDTYYGLFPSDAGEKYAFAVVPAADGTPFIMTDIATIQRFRFTSPKDGKHYFEGLKMPMDPRYLFDMNVMDKLSDINSLTDEDKITIAQIKRHSELMKRYRDLQYCKEEGVNFGYSTKPTIYSSRLKKVGLTAFFARWTKWKGATNTSGDNAVKLVYANYSAFQDKFRALLTSMKESHEEDQPTWFEDYFSPIGGVKAVLDVKMGSMKVGGEGATVKLVKQGKDKIDDKAAGLLGPIGEKDIVRPDGAENALSHLHFYMGMKSDGALFHDSYADRFEEALTQLEDHVNDMKLKNLNKVSEGGPIEVGTEVPSQEAGKGGDDSPF